MKLGRITKVTTQGIEESIIEFDGWNVLTGLITAGLITGVVAGLTFFFIDLPKSSYEREQFLRKEKFETLIFFLRGKSD